MERPGLRRRTASALGETRALLFQFLPDERDCIRMRIQLAHNKSVMCFTALKRLAMEDAKEVLPTLDMALDDVDAFIAWEKTRYSARRSGGPFGETTEERQLREKRQRDEVAEEKQALVNVLSALVAHAFLRTFSARQPLMDKLPADQQDRVRHVFGGFTPVLAADTTATPTDERRPLIQSNEPRSWFPLLERRNPHPLPNRDLHEFAAVQTFTPPQPSPLIRCRRYRLYPSRTQAHKLRCYMGTARWTYNQCVAYERAGYKPMGLSHLVKLFVTKTHGSPVDRPDGVHELPSWVFDTPASIRKEVVRQFKAALRAAFTNKARNNIRHFTMQFKSRKTDRYFSITEDARRVRISEAHEGAHRTTRSCLSITGLHSIPCSATPSTAIGGAVKIVNQHGFWYAIVPASVQPAPRSRKGRYTACDPGVKSFMTTMDLQGNATHYGRGCWDRIEHLKVRQRRAQSQMARFKHAKGRHTFGKWRRYAKARREFYCATAKIKYLVDELHYRTCTRLTDTADTILLPRFATSEMVKRSSPRTHTFNYRLLTLRHYRFKQRLHEVCERKDATLVICSEMYTSRTCGRCNQLHLSLGNNDVFRCPQCSFQAGRDENAAFNILRFVCAGSLQVFTVNGHTA